MSGTTEIRAALVQRLTAVSPGAALSVSQVAWENKKYVPTIGTAWYRATFLPGQQVAAAIGTDSANRNVGVFQIDVVYPKDAGDVTAQAEAERIAACYKRGTMLTYSAVNVRCERAYRGPAVQEDDWFFIPVKVEYRADTTN
jgi:hypothetical protein